MNVYNLSRLLISPRNVHLGNIFEGIAALQAPLIYSSRRFPWIVCMVTFLKLSFHVPVLWIETRSLHLVINFATVSHTADMRSYHKALSGVPCRSNIIFLLSLHELQKYSDDGNKVSLLPLCHRNLGRISQICCTVVALGLTVVGPVSY